MIEYDPLQPPNWQDPYPTYARLRDEAPVHYAERTGTYCISRYADVTRVLRDAETFSSAAAFEILMKNRASGIGVTGAFEVARFLYRARLNPLRMRRRPPVSIITSDPPQHDAMRAIVNRGFTPRQVGRWEPRMREIVASCTQKLRAGEPFDVVRDLAVPLPVSIIAELLGVGKERHADFKRWSDDIVAGSSGSRRTDTFGPFLRSMGELISTMRKVADERRRRPTDDLISALVDPRHGDTLDAGTLGQFVILLLVAGNETTTNLIGNGVKALLDHPDQLERLHEEPELLPNMIEEALRFDTPVQYIFRRTTRATEVAGTEIPEDASVCVLLASANRDGRRFEDPDRFDVTRDTRGHVGFGLGIHFCLGASLARLEARTAFEALLPELRRRRPAERRPNFVDSFLVRGLDRLELVPAGVA
ncbi:MAG: cytochrome P450 [Myxococcota bacterium]|nr:cytochrome P450 [Myxococcota bacterium]